MASRYVTVQTWSRGRFQPEKAPMLLLELVFGRGKGSYCFGSLRKVTG